MEDGPTTMGPWKLRSFLIPFNFKAPLKWTTFSWVYLPKFELILDLEESLQLWAFPTSSATELFKVAGFLQWIPHLSLGCACWVSSLCWRFFKSYLTLKTTASPGPMCSSCGMGMLEWWNQSATSRGKEVQFQIHWVERPCEKWFSSPWPVARLKNASCVQKDRFWTWCRVVVNRFGTCAQSPLLQMEGFSEVKLVLCWMSLHWVIVNRYMDDYGCTMIYTTSVTYLPMHNSLSLYIYIYSICIQHTDPAIVWYCIYM